MSMLKKMAGKLPTRQFDITALAHEAMDAHISTLSGVNRERANKIRLLRERGDVFTERLEKTMRKIAKYDQNTKAVRKAINDQKQLRKKLGGGENASQQLRAQVDKRMGHMEKRLNRAIQRHNEVESKHSSLKAKINRMRRDKLMYREVYKKLESKLEVKQKQMAVMIDKSNEIYNRREQTIKMIAALEKQATAIAGQKQPYERVVVTKDECLALFDSNPFKQAREAPGPASPFAPNPCVFFKQELILPTDPLLQPPFLTCFSSQTKIPQAMIRSKLPDGSSTTVYRCGPFIDLCKGP